MTWSHSRTTARRNKARVPFRAALAARPHFNKFRFIYDRLTTSPHPSGQYHVSSNASVGVCDREVGGLRKLCDLVVGVPAIFVGLSSRACSWSSEPAPPWALRSPQSPAPPDGRSPPRTARVLISSSPCRWPTRMVALADPDDMPTGSLGPARNIQSAAYELNAPRLEFDQGLSVVAKSEALPKDASRPPLETALVNEPAAPHARAADPMRIPVRTVSFKAPPPKQATPTREASPGSGDPREACLRQSNARPDASACRADSRSGQCPHRGL